MINKIQFRRLVQDTLTQLSEHIPYSKDAEDLIIMTASHESLLGTYIEQVDGPALGVFQMEPNTYDDIWDNYLEYRRNGLYEAVDAFFVDADDSDELRWNLKAAIVMCRVHYRRVPEAIPSTDAARALYAKEYYNTHLGKATQEEYLLRYENFGK